MRQCPQQETDRAAIPWPQILDRLEFILILAALMVVVLVYPLRLQEAWLRELNGYWDRGATFWARFTGAQLEAFCNFYFSPLLLKGALTLIPLMAFTAVRVARWGFAPRRGGGWAWVSVAAFFGWAALSALWSPTPPVSRAAALWVLLFGASLFALLRRGLRPQEAGCLARALVAMGAVVILIAFLQSAPLFRDKIFLVMNRFTDLRNRYGSLLGHNTAAASYLMMTLFPCLALLLGSWRPLMRIQYGFYLAAALFMILVLQSRAVWGITPVLGFLAIRSVMRGVRREWLPRWLPLVLLGSMAFGLLTQIIDSPKNPFYVRDNPLARRLKAVTVAGLMGDARVRLNVISATLVPRHPLKGHGLFAYQYIYPQRQAEFFATHTQSSLNQTAMRSNMAHNEYMQVLVDHGAIGLGLLLWVLGELAVRGWRRRRQLEGAERLLHESLGWSALAFALHSGFDFPFHIPQLAVPGVLCLAGWGSLRMNAECGRWNAEAESLDTVDGAPDEQSAPGVPPLPAWSAALNAWPHARPAAALLVILAIPLATFPLVRALQGDTLSIRAEAFREQFVQLGNLAQYQRDGLVGQSAAVAQAIQADGRLAPAARKESFSQAVQVMNTLQRAPELTPELKTDLLRRVADQVRALSSAGADPKTTLAAGERFFNQLNAFQEYSLSDRLNTLNQSVKDYRQALALAPYNNMMRLNLAGTYLHLGGVFADEAQHAAANPALAGQSAERARDYLRKGLATLEEAQRGINFHWLYWLRSQLCEKMLELDPKGESAALYRAMFEENIAKALFYCPHMDMFINAVLDVEESRPTPNAALLEDLQRRLHWIAPATFNTRYFNPTMQGFTQQRYAWAARRLDWLLKFDPDNSMWLNHAVRAHLLAGNRARSAELIKHILQVDPYSILTHGGAIPMTVLQQGWYQMLVWFHRTKQPADPLNAAEYRAIEQETVRLLSPKELARVNYSELRPVFNAPRGIDPATWRLLVAEALPGVRLHYFNEPERARQALEARIALGGPQPSVRFWIEGCYIALALKDQALLGRCRAQLQLLKAGDAPALADLGLAGPPPAAPAPPAPAPAGPAPGAAKP